MKWGKVLQFSKVRLAQQLLHENLYKSDVHRAIYIWWESSELTILMAQDLSRIKVSWFRRDVVCDQPLLTKTPSRGLSNNSHISAFIMNAPKRMKNEFLSLSSKITLQIIQNWLGRWYIREIEGWMIWILYIGFWWIADKNLISVCHFGWYELFEISVFFGGFPSTIT